MILPRTNSPPKLEASSTQVHALSTSHGKVMTTAPAPKWVSLRVHSVGTSPTRFHVSAATKSSRMAVAMKSAPAPSATTSAKMALALGIVED